MKKYTNQLASKVFRDVYQVRANQHHKGMSVKSTDKSKKLRHQKKHPHTAEGNSKLAKGSYGIGAIQEKSDIYGQALEVEMSRFLDSSVKLTDSDLAKIEIDTRLQSLNGLWQAHRRIRLTFSNFGKVMARKQTVKVAPIVTSLLYSAFAGNRHTRYGLEQEGPTREAYIKEMSKLGKSVQVTSLFTSTTTA